MNGPFDALLGSDGPFMIVLFYNFSTENGAVKNTMKTSKLKVISAHYMLK